MPTIAKWVEGVLLVVAAAPAGAAAGVGELTVSAFR
jgi:hypothetical protein